MGTEGYTAEQEKALDNLIKAFGITHSKRFEVVLSVYDGQWTEAQINPSQRIVRSSDKRSKI